MGLLVFWSFMVYGISSIIVWGSIFEKPRNWIKIKFPFLGELISCILCTSTWVGFIMSLLTTGLSINFILTWWPLSIFIDGMFSAGSTWALNTFVEYFEKNDE